MTIKSTDINYDRKKFRKGWDLAFGKKSPLVGMADADVAAGTDESATVILNPCDHPGCKNHQSHPCEKCGGRGVIVNAP